MNEAWAVEPREVPEELANPALDERLSVLRGFSVADHLDDRDRDALLELARHVI
jgi:hypothetical protein